MIFSYVSHLTEIVTLIIKFLENIQRKMMFIVYTNILLLFIHHGECLMKATAVLYRDGSNTTCGTLTFIQNDASTSVNVTGLVSGINATSEHVRLIKKIKEYFNYSLL